MSAVRSLSRARPSHRDRPRPEADKPAEGAAVLRLQRTAGNAAVSRLIQRQGFGSSRPHGPSLLGGETLTLDPEIEAEMRRIEFERMLRESLDPSGIRRALLSVRLDERPAWLPRPGEAPAAEPAPLVPRGRGPATPRAGTPGDIMGAVMAIPAVEGALTNLRQQATDRARADWDALSGGERVAVVGTGVTIGASALAGALSQPDSRDFLLRTLHNRDIPVPGVDGLSVAFSTERENLGVRFTLDVGRYLPASLGFGPAD